MAVERLTPAPKMVVVVYPILLEVNPLACVDVRVTERGVLIAVGKKFVVTQFCVAAVCPFIVNDPVSTSDEHVNCAQVKFPVTPKVPAMFVFPASETEKTVEVPALFLMFSAFTLEETFTISSVLPGDEL